LSNHAHHVSPYICFVDMATGDASNLVPVQTFSTDFVNV